MSAVVSISGLVKRFGSTTALDGLDLDVEPGTIHGFLGPNGAGKSTTIRILLGLLRSDGGRVELLGGDPWSDAVALHRQLAYVPGDVSLWPKLTGGETIDLLGRMRGDFDPARRDELVARFELDPTKRARTYSKGNRQKVALIAALASRAELLVLDEPTSGLDPLMESEFQRCIREVRHEGRTVLLSSHILAEVEALCDDVSIIRAGRTVQSGSLAELRHLTQTSVTAELVDVPADIGAHAGVHGLHVDGHRIQLDVDTAHLGTLLGVLTGAGVRSLVCQPPTLEELFLHAYGDEAGVMATLHGTGLLARAFARRDRTRIVVWVLAVGLLTAATASSIKQLYPTQADLDEAARASADSAIARAFKGPPLALDTVGGQVAFQIMVFGAIAVALMSILMVTRATRAEEEDGRLELVRALPVGRRAPLIAALVVVALMDVATGALVTVGLLAQGLPATGSVVVGAAFACVGFVFAGLTAVTAQLAENARVASGTAGAVLAAAFVVRAIGDVGDGTVSWLSPLGWAQKTRPFAGESVWPLLLAIAVAASLVVGAVVLLDRRDLGAGLVPARPGPATAAPGFADSGALARRLQRAGVVWWGLGVVVLGVAYGSIAGQIDDFVGDNDAVADVIARRGGSLVDSFVATSLLILSLVAAGFAVQSALRPRGEETSGRAEVVLSEPVGRVRWLGGHLAIAFVASAVAVVIGAAGLGLCAAIAVGDAGLFGRTALAGFAYVPAVWVLTAIAVALFGVVPRWTALAWAPLGVCVVIGLFGTLLSLPTAVLDVSPFEHTPSVPAASWSVLPLVVLVLVAAAITTGGLLGFRHRDVPA